MASDDDVYCAACGTAGADLKRCSACRSVYYCDASCQRTHRKDHKRECKKRAEELALDSLPWVGGRPEMGGIRGFAFMNKDDPQRYQTTYGSMHEKLWCEAGGLIDAELWDEATEKVAELRAYMGGRCDMKLESKLQFGLAMRGVGKKGHRKGVNEGIRDEKQFEMARQALRYVIQDDGGSDLDELSDKLYDLIDARLRAFIPLKDSNLKSEVTDEDDGSSDEDDEPYWVFDYGNASAENLVQAAKLWLEVPKAAKSVFVSPTDCGDTPHDETHQIVLVLGGRGEYAHARNVARGLMKVDPDMEGFCGPGIFLGAEAESSEALGEMDVAHRSYVKLQKCIEKNPSKSDFVNEFYHDGESFICKKVSPGSLSERISRTECK